MKDKDIASYREQVRAILQDPDEAKRIQKLKEVARFVGAGTEHTRVGPVVSAPTSTGTDTTIFQTPITEFDLVSGINSALQMATVMNVARRSSRTAMISGGTALIIALAACVSAVIAWVAIPSREEQPRYALSASSDGRGVYVLDIRTGELWGRWPNEVMCLGTRDNPKWEIIEYPDMEPVETQEPKRPTTTIGEHDRSDQRGTPVIPQSRRAGTSLPAGSSEER